MMIMEIIVGVIALSFVILVIFLLLTIRDVRKTLKKADRILTDIHHTLDSVSEPSIDLLYTVNKLTLDIKKKSEGLDVLFHPLYALKNKPQPGEQDTVSDTIGWVAEAIRLFHRIKKEIKG